MSSTTSMDLSNNKKELLTGGQGKQPGSQKNYALPGFILAWLVFAAIITMVPVSEGGLSAEGRAALAVMGWATVIWLTNALPIGISGLMIPVLLKLTGALPKIPMAFAGFTKDVTFLILGCFILAAVMQTTGLDRRIALGIVSRVKPKVGSVIKGLMAAHLVMAVLVPATNARGAVFLPIVSGLNNLFGKTGDGLRARKVLTMVGIGFASLASGIVLMHSHMSNVIVAQTINQSVGANTITWSKWAWMNWPMLGVLVIIYFWCNWILKTKNIEVPGGIEEVKMQKDALGKMSFTEWVVLVAFSMAILLWATDEFHKLGSAIVTLGVVMLLFIPGLTNLCWKKVQSNTIWGTWLLLCGSLSLVDAFGSTGVDKWLASHLVGIAPAWGWIGVTLFVCIVVQILRLGIVSNVAAVTLLAPIVAAMAPMLHLNTVAFTMAVLNVDSFAFVLPISVTACLIAYGTEEFSFAEFVKVGAPLTLMVILYTVFIMLPWYAFTGFPIWVPTN
ncbi:SLC13 family permease [Desulforamulus ruminis]|uniref:Sodium-dependent dicarboxylate transporter SdcS n=1 Tax=Desulforamulus ruminis (strain ATCC 23193 / DSM 2154 / NCIMB 8452 / DL) TaxID=696281 RepID=F6DV28_DESRL|nr:SLC13 family permease [Desulforamulus ruminis]AEG59094.1 sodium/sulphate symporter [Desulforamulus ruminis DSM 2154]